MEMAKINMEIKFSPEITIIVAGETLGRIGFKDVNELKEFIPKLKESIEVLIKEFRDRKKKIVKV